MQTTQEAREMSSISAVLVHGWKLVIIDETMGLSCTILSHDCYHLKALSNILISRQLTSKPEALPSCSGIASLNPKISSGNDHIV